MKYQLDLTKIGLNEYKNVLKGQNLLPSRVCLLEDVDARFALLLDAGIDTVYALRKELSSKQKTAALIKKTGIPEQYLMILNRESGTMEQKTVGLDRFPGIDKACIDALAKKGIKTTKDYYESALEEKDELFCLSDLIRINGVGSAAAKTFYEAGYRSAQDVAGADAQEMLERVSEVNRIIQYYKANLGVKDMQFCIDFAKLLCNNQ